MKKLLVLVLAMMTFSACSEIPAMAWPEVGVNIGLFSDHHDDYHRRYEYRDGHYWRDGVIIAGLTAGVIIASLPPHYTIVHINGYDYYYDGVYYYQSSPQGYIVVDQPIRQVIVPSIPECPQGFQEIRIKENLYYVKGHTWLWVDGTQLISVPDQTIVH